MASTLDILDPLSYPGWDDLLAAGTGASFFHSSAWARVLHQTYGYRPAYFARIDGRCMEFLLPVMEVASFVTGRRGVALPFCDDCEPIVPPGADILEAVPSLLDYGRTRGWKSLVLRQHAHPLAARLPWQRYVLHTLTLTADVDRLFAAFKSSTRRNVQKAMKSSVEITMENTPESLGAYYGLHCLTRKRQGVPPQPFAFFRSLYDHVLEKKQGLIVLARHGDIPVAGAVYLRFGDRSYYKYGASDMRYQHLRAFNLVMASAIRHYAEQGCTSFCFGRTEPDNEGLLQFKNGWNAQVKQLNYYKYDFRKDGFEAEKPGGNLLNQKYNNVLRKLPLWSLKMIGGLLYRHVA